MNKETKDFTQDLSEDLTEDSQKQKLDSPLKGFLKSLIVCLYCAGALALVAWTITKELSVSALIDGLTVLNILLFGFLGYLNGIAREIIFLVRFLGSLTVAYLLRTVAGSQLHLGGFLGQISGFYLIFLGLYTIIGLFLSGSYFYKFAPSSFQKKSGSLLGIIEGFFLSILLCSAVSLIPLGKSNSFQTEDSNVAKFGRLLLPSSLPGLDQKTYPFINLAMNCKNGIDPQKIDRQKILNEFRSLQDNPAIQDIKNDTLIQEYLRDGKFSNVLMHPKVRNLVNDNSFVDSVVGLNWSSICEEISKATKKNASTQ
ncbi:MAG: CvpA family protein [Candidatus Riflebacteria bacterium]|nr:CvpA family protein [Candidatus Riflebacteria bacterium]